MSTVVTLRSGWIPRPSFMLRAEQMIEAAMKIEGIV